MKTFLLKCTATLLLSGLIFSACKKSGQSFQSKGVITKNPIVLFNCNGCWSGVFFIKFTNDTTLYDIDNNINQFITPGTKFPANVSVNWTADNAAGHNYVIITALKVNN